MDRFFHLDVEVLERLEVLAQGFLEGVEGEGSHQTQLTHVALKVSVEQLLGHSILAVTRS